jgi:preprotein translocase subunit SecA
MTGTAREIAPELWSVYGLGVERIATHRPLRRTVCKDQCTVTAAEKWNAVLTAARTVQECGRPVLIGTRTVADSEIVSEALSRAGLGHVVLNARDAAEEAAIVAQAGQAGRITVATNMAGRGTDIRLGAGVSEQGGLHVLSTCFHEARRIDRQLFGRCGRQGDCGSYQTIVSLEDEIFELYLPPWIKAVLVRFFDGRGVLPPRLLPLLRWAVQRRAEARHARIRRDMMRLDENLSDMLAFSGRPE